MALLLDSNVIWRWASAPELILRLAMIDIEAPRQQLFISVASVWELEIKQAIGKLDLTANFWPSVEARRVEVLEIGKADAIAAARLPLHHRDPFDRMIIAQALARGLTIVTSDRIFGAYDAPLLAA